MMKRPHFIIIGAMKCATSTLHEQLARQPGIFMSDPKEPNYFSDDDVFARGEEWYAGLFAAAREDELCGESSTHYSKRLTHPSAVPRMHAALGDRVRLIYIMRHPIDRLVSHYIHEWSQGLTKDPIDTAIRRLPALVDSSRYAWQMEPYLDTFGSSCVLPVFLERLKQRPQEELERVCRFIGHHGDVWWDTTIEDQNVSARRLRRSAVRDWLLELPGARFLRRTLVPKTLRDRVKRRWVMSKRPTLSVAAEAELKEQFDADLARLEPWLGLRLACDTWAQSVSVQREASPHPQESAA